MSWYINGSYPYQELSDDLVPVFTEPYPTGIFQTDGTRTPYMPLSDDLVPVFTEPYPTGIMIGRANTIPMFSELGLVDLGAFLNASGLHSVTIPNTVTHIGKTSFKGTGLTCVDVPSQCVYKTTTFPEGCEVRVRSDDA